MSYGFALTEDFPLQDCRPTARYGTLGLPKANKIPEVESIIVEKPGLMLEEEQLESEKLHPFRPHQPSVMLIINTITRQDMYCRWNIPLIVKEKSNGGENENLIKKTEWWCLGMVLKNRTF